MTGRVLSVEESIIKKRRTSILEVFEYLHRIAQTSTIPSSTYIPSYLFWALV